MRPNSIIMKQEACQAAEKGHDEFLKAFVARQGLFTLIRKAYKKNIMLLQINYQQLNY